MSTSFLRPIAVWAGCLLAAVVLRFGPMGIAESLRSGFQEATDTILWKLQAGLAALAPEQPEASRQQGDSSETPSGNEQAQLLAENRELAALAARLRRELDAVQAVPPGLSVVNPPESLQVEAVETKIIGAHDDRFRSSRQLLVAVGRREGLTGEELVLNGAGILLDRGNQWGLAADQWVTAGMSLCGRVEQAGRWTSRVQPVTDAGFAVAAQLIRMTPQGPVYGARGLMQGTGQGCRLEEVPATEAVAIGDLVFTDERVSPVKSAIHCGRVVHAEVRPGSSRWSIEVEPACRPEELPPRLSVLRARWQDSAALPAMSGQRSFFESDGLTSRDSAAARPR